MEFSDLDPVAPEKHPRLRIALYGAVHSHAARANQVVCLRA